MKQTFTVLLIIFLAGCMQTTILKNGYQKAPVNPKVFKNKVYFDQSILTQIDTNVIYEEYAIKYTGSEIFYGAYRFYGNGCYSLFHLNRNKPELTKEMFDPTYTGWRGVLYRKNGKITGDLITQIGQMPWEIGKQKQEISVNGDTLFVQDKYHRWVYIKRQINTELLHQIAEW